MGRGGETWNKDGDALKIIEKCANTQPMRTGYVVDFIMTLRRILLWLNFGALQTARRKTTLMPIFELLQSMS